jgi:uncharacterized protein YjbI with pentapeptide repeats
LVALAIGAGWLAAVVGLRPTTPQLSSIVSLVDTRYMPPWPLVLGIVLLLLFLWLAPMGQIALAKGVPPEKRFEAEQEARKTLAQILGGALVLVAFYQTWASTQVAQEGQITTRFTQAIEQLGATQEDKSGAAVPQLDMRVGAIYALERIGKDSPADYVATLDILSLYVRRHAGREASEAASSTVTAPAPELCVDRPRDQPPLRDDVQASLYVIGRRRSEAHSWFVDLSNTDLRGACLYRGNLTVVSLARSDLRHAVITSADLGSADLERARLEGARLSGARLSRAWLVGANLQRAVLHKAWAERLTEDEKATGKQYSVRIEGADLQGAELIEAELPSANLERAVLNGAHLEHANLEGANLSGAFLGGAYMDEVSLIGASLEGAHLHGAVMPGAKLQRADLRGADLTKANLRGATLAAWLGGANLDGAELQGADLTEADGLTWEQVSVAVRDADTRLPAHLGAGQ